MLVYNTVIWDVDGRIIDIPSIIVQTFQLYYFAVNG
jgi:hypothetical protein